MRRPLLRVAGLALLGLGALAAPAVLVRPADAGGNVLDGQAAPELTLAGGTNGASASTTLASLRGKVVCLKFWLTGCPICRRTLPEFQSIHDRYGRSGVVCLGVVIDSVEGVSPYLKEMGWSFAVGADPDGRNASRYGVNHYPADYVIGIDGVVRASNGFPRDVIEGELRKVRVAELGKLPAGAEGVREAVEDGDYGEALRRAEAAAKAAGASAELTEFVARFTAVATQRFENRLARVERLRADGKVVDAKGEAERILSDFRGTSLEARARERLEALGK